MRIPAQCSERPDSNTHRLQPSVSYRSVLLAIEFVRKPFRGFL
ncbi:uncharacterized protein METZ01_LOCUS85646 [marine metagenome]|uniref:Uncharacterized protein n=1 Tax=marine metagenome TaxID=408172 RepID=A0A381UXC9_9ZZZZ